MSEGVSPAGKLPGSNPDSATPASSPARQRAGLACRGAGTLRAGGVAWQGALGAVGGGCFTISRLSGARGSPAACPQGPVCFITCQPRCTVSNRLCGPHLDSTAPLWEGAGGGPALEEATGFLAPLCPGAQHQRSSHSRPDPGGGL